MQKLVARAAKIAALERACECAVEATVERSELSRQFIAGRQQHAEQRGVDVGGVAVA
jgi:hypothetical protein